MDSERLGQTSDGEDESDYWKPYVGCVFPSKDAACRKIQEWAVNQGVQLVHGHSKDTEAEQLCKCLHDL